MGGDVWHLTLSFQDAVYSGAGQEEAETILGTLVLSAASAAEPNSLTSDDTKIMSEIKDGWTEVGAILDRTTTGADLSEMVDAFGELRDFARLEQTRIDAYAPSGCTERAADLYKRAMVLTESAASDFLAMVASGTAPSTSSDFSEAGGTLGDALNAVNASSCH